MTTPVVYDSGYQVSFYLRQIRPVLKHCKVLKYYDEDCLKGFVLYMYNDYSGF